MHALHELLTTDGRILNRHAGKMYGFIPGIVTAVHDPKLKRHMRGYVKVHFPGLQDEAGPEAPILPWARFVSPNAGGMLETKKCKKEKRKCPTWERVAKKEKFSYPVEVEEPIYGDKEESIIEGDEKLENFQAQLDVHFEVDHPKTYEMDKIHPSVFKGGIGAAKAKVKDFVGKLKAKLQEAKDFEELEVSVSKPKIYLDAHTSPTATREYNKPLSDRRASYLYDLLIDELDAQDIRGKVDFAKSSCHGYGRECTGMGRHVKTLSIVAWDQLPAPKHPHPKYKQCIATQDSTQPKYDNPKPSATYECDGCRRVDVTAQLSTLTKKSKKTTKKTKVIVGYKKTVKNIEGERTVYEVKKKEIEIEVEVCEPGKPAGTGFYCPPQIGDEVVCAFEHGDMHFPYVLGSVWNGKAKLPEPSTPADDKRDKKGPQTPSMKGDSLCGGGGKNKIGYFKSRTGNIVSMDDAKGVVRIADRSGMSTIQLSAGKIEIMQSTADIFFFAKETIRFDCKDFEVYAKQNIWHHATNHYGAKAGKNNTIEAGGTWSLHAKGSKDTDPGNGITGIKFKSGTDMKIGADKMVTLTGKGSHTKLGMGLQLRTTAGKIGMMSKDAKFEIDAKADAKFTTLMKHASGAEGDYTVKTDGGIDMNALMKIKWKGEKALLNAGGKPAGALTLGSIVGAVIRGAKAMAGKIASGAAAAVKAVAAKAQQAAAAAGAAIANSPLGKIVGAAAKAVNNAGKAIAGAAQKLGAAAQKAAGAVMNAAQGIANKAVGLMNQAVGAAKNLAQKALAPVAAMAQKAVSAIGGAVNKMKEAVVGAAAGMVEKIKDAGNAVLEGATHIVDQLKDKAGEVMGKIDEAVGAVKKKVGEVAGQVKDAAAGIVGGIKDKVGELGAKAQEFAGKVENMAGEAKQAIGHAVGAVGEQLAKAGEALKGLGDQLAKPPAGPAPAHQGAGAGQDAGHADAGQDAGDGAGAGQDAGGAGAGQDAGGGEVAPRPVQDVDAPDARDRWGNQRPMQQAN